MKLSDNEVNYVINQIKKKLIEQETLKRKAEWDEAIMDFNISKLGVAFYEYNLELAKVKDFEKVHNYCKLSNGAYNDLIRHIYKVKHPDYYYPESDVINKIHDAAVLSNAKDSLKGIDDLIDKLANQFLT